MYKFFRIFLNRYIFLSLRGVEYNDDAAIRTSERWIVADTKRSSAYRNDKRQKGISLVELSVVLGIIGITLAGAIDLAIRKTESDRVKETNVRMDAIEQAMQVYLINNQLLPCPANASLALSNSAAGVSGVTAGTPDVCNTNFSTASGIWAGAVPTKTIGLSDKIMADDWDRRFTYVVDNRVTNNSITTNNCSSTSGSEMCFKNTTPLTGSITINDSTGANITTQAIYVLISHGKNGYGAFKYTGNATQLAQPASPDAGEVSNAATSNGTLDNIFVQRDTNATFDDTVRYKTKANIIEEISGITDANTCLAALDNVNQNVTATSTDPCIGLTGPIGTVGTALYNCNQLGIQVNNFCLQP